MLLPHQKVRYPQPLYIHCMKGADTANNFPFKTTSSHLGILFSREFKQENTTLLHLCQEKKSKEKNAEYLQVLEQVGVIDAETMASAAQSQELLKLELSPANMIRLDFEAIAAASGRPRYNAVQVFLHKLKFFHTWLFYYFYSADQKFLKNLIKCRFQFSTVLFGGELTRIYESKTLTKILQKIYCPNIDKTAFRDKYINPFYDNVGRRIECQIYPFIVPLQEYPNSKTCDLGFGEFAVTNSSCLQVDLSVIDRAIRTVREKLLDIINLPSKRDVRTYLDLDEPVRSIHRQ
jgi:hypothetical protein